MAMTPFRGCFRRLHQAGLRTSSLARRRPDRLVDRSKADASVGPGIRIVETEMDLSRSSHGHEGAKHVGLFAGLDLDDVLAPSGRRRIQRLEPMGYHFEAADASLELLTTRSGFEQQAVALLALLGSAGGWSGGGIRSQPVPALV